MNIIIIQARLNSSRLSSKVLLKIGKKNILDIINLRLNKIKYIDKIIFAIPNNFLNKKLDKYLKSKNINTYLGSSENVLERFYKAAKKEKATNVIRLTADCPFVDKKLIEKMLMLFKEKSLDYLSNTINPSFPDGLDVEIFKFSLLKKISNLAKSTYDREHVTTLMKSYKGIKKHNYLYKSDLSNIRLTLDKKEDYVTLKNIFENFKFNYNISWKRVAKYYQQNYKLMSNKTLVRNYKSLSKTQKMWIKALNFIPDGNLMISKNPSMFGEKNWPSHFSKAKGCFIWDLDNSRYTDCSLMGVGTNILGYSNPQVDRKVIKVIKSGNISSLNSFEEVALAEKLIHLNNWADKVLFAKTGAEANSISVRLARLYSGKDKVAICGYHGWHDWFLSSSNKNEKKIQKSFLPFYSNKGIPKYSLNTVVHFEYNNIQSLEKILASDKQIGTIKMEVLRNEYPKNNFLQKVKNLSQKYNKVLIFDECTTGFRQSLGGIYKKYNVEPDILILGKALGNGYPITSVIGRNEIMSLKKKTFISSTFWTDRIGPTAALETLDIMERDQTWKKITANGNKVLNFWRKLSKRYKLPLQIQGLPALANYSFKDSKNNLLYRSYLIKYLLKNNYLSSNIFYSSISHKDKILNKYFELLDEGFFSLKKSIDNGEIKLFDKDLETIKTFR